MAVLESRQVVVWSIPTLAALFLSLVWLRRRRQNGRPDPSISDPICDPGGTAVNSSTPAVLRSVSIHIPISPIVDDIGSPSFVDEGNGTGFDPFNAEEVAEVIPSSSGQVVEEPPVPEPADSPEEEEVPETKEPFDGNKTIELFLESSFSSTIGPDSGLGPGVFATSVPELGPTLANKELEDRQSEEEDLTEAEISCESEVCVQSEETPTENCNALPEVEELSTTQSMSEIFTDKTVDNLVEEKDESEEVNCDTLEQASPVSLPDSKTTVLSEEEGMPEVADMEKGVLEEKLASLELDTMKIGEEGGKDSAERDSANQSPSEVMLASPSISNFSDAHSEGSSDSGKGHSDVATSPSRTPAGGSSVAGDSAFSVYEFVLPQVMVGRLIGRHGSFIHEIRTSTHTNIFIKRHPETSKLKICAIEGPQQDIDKALEKIRQKFPLRRFPKLTLEKVSFLSLNNPPPLKPEDFHLQLVEGVNNDVILSSLISAAHFFLQQPSHPTYTALSRLNQVMNVVYSNRDAPVLETPIKDAICAAPTMGGWYRAQIVDLDEDNQKCDVRFLDYGGYLTLDASLLRQIRGDLLMLPFQAVECYLANVLPVGEEGWSEEARLVVQSLTHGQLLQAQIYDYAEDGIPQVYLYSTAGAQIVLINEELVARGYATVAPPAEE